MMMLLIVASLALSTLAQTCDQAEVDKYYKCLEQSRPQHGSQGGPGGHGGQGGPGGHGGQGGGHGDQGGHGGQGGSNGHGGPNGGKGQGEHNFARGNSSGFGDFMKKRNECYTKNNCKAPEPQKPQQTDDKTKECFKTNADAVKKCIDGKGAHFPKPQGGNDQHHWGGQHGGHMGGGHGGHFGGHGGPKVDPATCPAAPAVQSCLENLRPTHGPKQDGPSTEERKQKFEKMCSAKQACVSAMPQSCQDLLTKSKKDRCDCMTQQKSGFQSCFPNANGQNGGHGGSHGFKGGCEDRCAQGFKDNDDH